MSLFPNGLFPEGTLFPNGVFADDEGEGEQRKAAALQQLQISNAEALRLIRAELAQLYRRRVEHRPREEHFVTADDARRVYERLPEGVRPRKTAFLGAVFKSAEWEWTGHMVKSLRAGRHAGLLYCWRLK